MCMYLCVFVSGMNCVCVLALRFLRVYCFHSWFGPLPWEREIQVKIVCVIFPSFAQPPLHVCALPERNARPLSPDNCSHARRAHTRTHTHTLTHVLTHLKTENNYRTQRHILALTLHTLKYVRNYSLTKYVYDYNISLTLSLSLSWANKACYTRYMTIRFKDTSYVTSSLSYCWLL